MNSSAYPRSVLCHWRPFDAVLLCLIIPHQPDALVLKHWEDLCSFYRASSQVIHSTWTFNATEFQSNKTTHLWESSENPLALTIKVDPEEDLHSKPSQWLNTLLDPIGGCVESWWLVRKVVGHNLEESLLLWNCIKKKDELFICDKLVLEGYSLRRKKVLSISTICYVISSKALMTQPPHVDGCHRRFHYFDVLWLQVVGLDNYNDLASMSLEERTQHCWEQDAHPKPVKKSSPSTQCKHYITPVMGCSNLNGTPNALNQISFCKT